MKLEQLERRQLLSAALDGGILRILTGAASDTIAISLKDGKLQVQESGVTSQFELASVSRIRVETGAGNDLVQAAGIAIPIEAYLGVGSDTLFSGSASDTVYGGGGSDLINTGDGNDVIYGEAGDDRIIAGGGSDTVTGGGGNDAINTGSTGETVYDSGRNINQGRGMVFAPASQVTGYTPGDFEANVTGYDPYQIRNAYGFDSLDGLQTIDWARLPDIAKSVKRGGEVSSEDLDMLQTAYRYGYGQTIYIVDAYTGLNVEGDFDYFCQQFDLPSTADRPDLLTIVNANGGRHGKSDPAIDAGWAGEINLDLQWAHAIAPGAKLVLVQADSAISLDMYRAVVKAGNMAQKAGGGVVSMSFGWNRVYDPGVTGYDPTTSPDMFRWDNLFRSKSKVTFLAASHDYGDLLVAGWPAMSPYVTAVGGTVLHLDQDGNQNVSEEAWFNGGSGYALPDWYERPTYQDGIGWGAPDPSSPMTAPAPEDVRGIPDISFNAEFYAIYSTTPSNGDTGWATVAGTSAGTPAWAGLVALANARRVMNAGGQRVIGNRLNGILYNLYNGYGTDENGDTIAYRDCFSDISVGQAGPWYAIDGYDMATGIGSPKADRLIDAMVQDSFFLQSNFTFKARLYMPLSVSAGGLFPVGSGQLRTGTGSILGTDQLHVSFLTNPLPFYGPNFTPRTVADQYYDVDAGEASAFRVQLARNGRGQTSGRIYGFGTADIQNADTRVVFGTATFTLRFDGRWWTGRDGQVHFHIDFRAVDDVTHEPLESRPASLVFDPTVAWFGAYYAGEING